MGPREGQTRFSKTFAGAATDVSMAVEIEGSPRLPQKVIIWEAGTYELKYEPNTDTPPVYGYTDLFTYAPADDHPMEIDAPVAAVGSNTTNGNQVKGIY